MVRFGRSLLFALAAYTSSPIQAAPLFFGSNNALINRLDQALNSRQSKAVYRFPRCLGQVVPADAGNGAFRLTLPYAQAPVGNLRFASPQPLTTVSAGFDAAKLPPSCYQGSTAPRGGNDVSEDCLYMNVFFPPNLTPAKKLPIFVWLPGGSFIGGSATAAGLDGSKLATEQNIIVVVAQYRLGAFGWLQTAETLDEHGGAAKSATVAGNQAARDVTAALQFIHDTFEPFGGDTGRITLSGQSSGAQMVRSLLTVPAASALFQQALLVSDTQDYGPATQESQNKLGKYVLQQLKCSDINCARGKTADEVLDASYAAYSDVPAGDGSLPAGSPWRPTQGSWMTSAIEKQPESAFVGANKRIILTSIVNEAGAAVGQLFGRSTANATNLQYQFANATFQLPAALDLFFNQNRGQLMMAHAAYQQEEKSLATTEDGLRSMLETSATDGLWRCSTQHNARQLAAHGDVWLAEHKLGYAYPSNADIDYCQDAGKHCHEDDIYLIFGTLPANANVAQQTFSKELRSRYGNFIRSGDPNAAGFEIWEKVDQSGDKLNMLQGGSQIDGSSTISSAQRSQICSAWGQDFKFDWQLYS